MRPDGEHTETPLRFEDLGLSADLLRTVEEEGYTEPTPVQERAIPIVLEGRDVLAAAQTGTGKTAAFTLPILDRLKGHANTSFSPARHPVRCLVLTPTRELAMQVADSVKTYGRRVPLRSAVVYGGVPLDPQIKELLAGVEILVATPGRLLDLERQLTRGREDERAHRAARGSAVRRRGGRGGLRRVEPLEERQHERGGLAGAGLGAGEQVAAGEDERDGLALDGRGLGVALVGDGAQVRGRQPEAVEGHGNGTLLKGPSRRSGARSGQLVGVGIENGGLPWTLTGASFEHVYADSVRHALPRAGSCATLPAWATSLGRPW